MSQPPRTNQSMLRPIIAAWACLSVASAVAAGIPLPETVDSIGMTFVEIPAGQFSMGGNEPAEAVAEAFGEYGRDAGYFADEYPRHRVQISRPFLLGKHEVTVGQFRAFVEATGYRTEAEQDGTGGWGYDPAVGRCIGRDRRFDWAHPGFEQSDRHPVLNVTWNDAQAFCRWLGTRDGRSCRLPTEAEWEYACRAGATTRYSFGDGPAALPRHGRTLDPAGKDVRMHVQDLPIAADGGLPLTVPVGSFPPNAFGLHDMHGNVWEWVEDWYDEHTYESGSATDPSGPRVGRQRVRRGGGWNSFPLWARSSFRNVNTQRSRCVNLGFRVAADADEPRRRQGGDGTLSIVFVGDINLADGPGHVISSGRDPFAACRHLLADGDFTVGNLECVPGRGGRQVLKPYTFRAAADAPRFLQRHFSAVSLANNHSCDFGPDGLLEACRILDEAGIRRFGAGRTLPEARRPLVLERNGLKVAILGYNGFQSARTAATGTAAGAAPLLEEMVLEDIRAARKAADAVVPFLHWGTEDVVQPRSDQVGLARRMIDAGAAAVIGGHPHVTQTVDTHRGAPIVYSLGNFVFDYFPVDPPQWTGWVAKLTFRPSGPVDLETRAVILDPAGLPHPVVVDEPTAAELAPTATTP
jgi:formylglycine-generating enzyme required for sulfatase activity